MQLTTVYFKEEFIRVLRSFSEVPEIPCLDSLNEFGFKFKKEIPHYNKNVNKIKMYVYSYEDKEGKIEFTYEFTPHTVEKTIGKHHDYKVIKFLDKKISYISTIKFYRHYNGHYILENRKNKLKEIHYNMSGQIVKFFINNKGYYMFPIGPNYESNYYLETERETCKPFTLFRVFINEFREVYKCEYLLDNTIVSYESILQMYPNLPDLDSDRLIHNLKDVLTHKELQLLSMMSI